MYMDDSTELRSQLFLPPLQYAILRQGLNESTKHVSESLCKDDPKWTSSSGKTCMDYSIEGSQCSDTGTGGKTATDACLVACNNCPSHITLERSEGHMYDRLPSPVAEGVEPPYSSGTPRLTTSSTRLRRSSTTSGKTARNPSARAPTSRAICLHRIGATRRISATTLCGMASLIISQKEPKTRT